MSVGVRTKYHIGINGKGFMLKGTPTEPQYIKEDVPTVANDVAPDDVSYSLLNGAGWKYWPQTDWSGGFQQIKWKDNATFKDGQAIDVQGSYGDISLQSRFVSAAVISAGTHSYGAHAVHDTTFLFGTVKSGGARLYSLNTSNSLSLVSAMTGMSAVNSMDRFGADTLVGMTRTSGTIKTLSKYNGTTLSGFRSTNPIVRAIKGIGIRAYISEYIASLSGDRLSYATNLSAFTSAYNAGKNRKIPKILELNGNPYFFIQTGNQVEMCRWDEYSERAYPIYGWSDLTSWGATKYLSYIIITGTSNGTKVQYAFNGAKLWQIFSDELDDSSYDFSKPFVYEDNLHVKGVQWDGEFFFPGLYGKFATVQYTPFGNFNAKAYGYAASGARTIIGYVDTTKYETSGYVISSEFGHDIGKVDKLVNCADINCDALATGQTIQAYRSTDGGSSFTSIGTLSYASDGAIKNKTLYFPSGFVTKLWNYKLQLVGPAAGTSTPTVKDIAFEYRPMPTLKKHWTLLVDAGDDIRLLNQQQEARDSKALMSELWLEKEAKRTVIFEDIDGFEADVAASVTSAATTIKVSSTNQMPPKGRARIMSGGVVEEITYTSADGNFIKGISRAQKGTKNRAYTTSQKVDNFYTVIITGIKERLDSTNQNTTQSLAQITILEV